MTHGTDALEVPAELPFTLASAPSFRCCRQPQSIRRWFAATRQAASLRALTVAVLVVIYVLAIARAVTVPFQPFIYFRF